MPASTIPNVNCLWGEVAAGTLARLGLRHVVIAPGSRSGPLTWAFARQKGIEAIPVLDERSAAFYALGLAKAANRPVALICTSGTAAANFFPAIIEASLSAVPLLVLTADPQPELRDCHAGQAIDQVKIYGHYPRWQHEMALPENNPALLRYLRQTMVHAWERAERTWPGPVHLNFPFREPLAPVKQEGFAQPSAKTIAVLLEGVEKPLWGEVKIGGRTFGERVRKLLGTKKGIIVAGPMNPLKEVISQRLFNHWFKERGWPVLADALSPLREEGDMAAPLIAHYDLILRSAKNQARLKPEAVIQLGPLPTSKMLRKWLGSLDAPVLVVHDGPDNVDPLHRQVIHWRGDAALILTSNRPIVQPDIKYANVWRQLEEHSGAAVTKQMEKLDWLFEGKAAWLLSQQLPKDTPVFVASSMPVRDCEYFWEPGAGQEFYFNRGANGIDGTLSSALGVAHALKKPTVLYTGDLALLHDQNGFLAAKELAVGASLTIVLINNDGGGIFEHLPIAKFNPPFERLFATPQGIDFKKLAALHGCDYHCPATWAGFKKSLLPLPKRGLRLIELRTDRKRDAAFRAKIFREISKNL